MRNAAVFIKLAFFAALLLDTTLSYAQTKCNRCAGIDNYIAVLETGKDDDRIFQAAKLFENFKLSADKTQKRLEAESILKLLAYLLPIDHTSGTSEFFPVIYKGNETIFKDELKKSSLSAEEKTRIGNFFKAVERSSTSGNG